MIITIIIIIIIIIISHNIISFFTSQNENLFIVLEFCAHGSLHSFLRRCHKMPTFDHTLLYFMVADIAGETTKQKPKK